MLPGSVWPCHAYHTHTHTHTHMSHIQNQHLCKPRMGPFPACLLLMLVSVSARPSPNFSSSLLPSLTQMPPLARFPNLSSSLLPSPTRIPPTYTRHKHCPDFAAIIRISAARSQSHSAFSLAQILHGTQNPHFVYDYASRCTWSACGVVHHAWSLFPNS